MSKKVIKAKNKRRVFKNSHYYISDRTILWGGNLGRGCFSEEYYHTDLNGKRIETNPFSGQRIVI